MKKCAGTAMHNDANVLIYGLIIGWTRARAKCKGEQVYLTLFWSVILALLTLVYC